MPDEISAAFLARLWEIQAEAGLSNSALARLLGVHPSYISRLRSGQRGHHLTLQLALRAASQFPELHTFLSSVSPTITDYAPESTAEAKDQ